MDATERLPDNVMLDYFERHIERAEHARGETPEQSMALIWEFTGFMDQNARRLLLLARTCVAALERQSKEPT